MYMYIYRGWATLGQYVDYQVGTRYRGVQWERGAVDWGCIT